MTATQKQVALLHHTLGLRPERRSSHRNHFVAGEGHHDMPDLQVLVGLGLMGYSPTPKFCNPSDIVFHVTDEGHKLAAELLPLPPKRTRYGEFQAMDCAETFGEFLTGNRMPRYETESDYSSVGGRYKSVYRHRMYRVCWIDSFGRHRDVQGEWATTKKDAKASYKAALKKHREEVKS
jgi:hypothetical protein